MKKTNEKEKLNKIIESEIDNTANQIDGIINNEGGEFGRFSKEKTNSVAPPDVDFDDDLFPLIAFDQDDEVIVDSFSDRQGIFIASVGEDLDDPWANEESYGKGTQDIVRKIKASKPYQIYMDVLNTSGLMGKKVSMADLKLLWEKISSRLVSELGWKYVKTF